MCSGPKSDEGPRAVEVSWPAARSCVPGSNQTPNSSRSAASVTVSSVPLGPCAREHRVGAKHGKLILTIARSRLAARQSAPLGESRSERGAARLAMGANTARSTRCAG
jgi:hypothetical protein